MSNYWTQRQQDSLQFIAEKSYENTNKLVSEFIANNFQVLSLEASWLMATLI